jgi:hypothetical protein
LSAEPVFGRRGARTALSGSAAPRVRAEAGAPSYAYLKVAEAARAAFSGEDAPAEAFGAPAGPALAPNDAAMRVFVGAHWSSYSELWRTMADAPKLRASAPFSAAVLTGVWLIYRKQYIMGVALLALEALLASYDLNYGLFVHLAAAAFLGRFGKSIVLLAGVSAIANAERLDGAAKLDAVRAAGGTSLPAAALAFTAASAFAVVALRLAPPEPDAAGLLRNVLDALP